MPNEFLTIVGYYDIFINKTPKSTKYIVDSGKTIFIAKFRKYIINPYRDCKEFSSLEKAKEYAQTTLKKKAKVKLINNAKNSIKKFSSQNYYKEISQFI